MVVCCVPVMIDVHWPYDLGIITSSLRTEDVDVLNV